MKTDRLFLADTSVWILSLRPGDRAQVKKDMELLLSEQGIATAEIIILELMRGIPTRREFMEMERDMHALPVLECDDEVWKTSQHLAFDLKAKGVTIPTVDLLIASLAIRHGALLLHADKHFHLIAQKTSLTERYYVS